MRVRQTLFRFSTPYGLTAITISVASQVPVTLIILASRIIALLFSTPPGVCA
jgi:hypothetical protein